MGPLPFTLSAPYIGGLSKLSLKCTSLCLTYGLLFHIRHTWHSKFLLSLSYFIFHLVLGHYHQGLDLLGPHISLSISQRSATLGLKMTSPPLEILRKFIRFGSLTRPLVYKGIYVC